LATCGKESSACAAPRARAVIEFGRNSDHDEEAVSVKKTVVAEKV
jgi:hypothetical protein